MDRNKKLCFDFYCHPLVNLYHEKYSVILPSSAKKIKSGLAGVECRLFYCGSAIIKNSVGFPDKSEEKIALFEKQIRRFYIAL